MADREPAIATDATRPRHAVGTPLAVLIALLATLVGLLALAWTVLYISKGRFLRPTFERLAGSALQRDVRVRGDFQFYFDPIDLHFLADGFTVSNPRYASRPNLFEARHVEARLPLWTMVFGRRRFHWLDLRDGRVDLEWAPDHLTNSWTFGTPDPRHHGKPFELPVIDRATVTGTTVRYRDTRFPLLADLGLDAIRSSGARIGGDVGFTGKGVVRSTPFTATGALLSPNATVGRGKNELRLEADAAGNHLSVHGTLPGLADFENVPLSVSATGHDMAALFDVIGVVWPHTRHYRLAATMTKSGERYDFAGMTGRFGASDLAGRITVENRKPRLHLQAALTTRRLDIVDAAPFIGYNPDIVATQGAAAASGQSQATPHLLPDTALPVEKLGNFDADATWHVGAVRSKRVPLENIDLTLKLFDRKLTMDPLDFTMARGHVASTWTIDARARPAHWTSDVRLAPTPMGRLLAGWGVEEAGTSGVVKGRITLAGDGDSFARWLATSHGRIAFVLPAGTFWTRNVQLSELDVGVFVQKMFEHQLKEPVRINCGLIAFSVRNGIGAADPILIDTQKNVMLGRGGFSFKNEAMDLAFRADAKKFSLFAGQSPVGIHGYFAKPGLQVISPELLGRAGAALGLALVASPPAALLAFVDPGDAKAAACGPVLAGATAVQQRDAKGRPRDDVGHGTTATREDGHRSRAQRHEQRKKFLGIF